MSEGHEPNIGETWRVHLVPKSLLGAERIIKIVGKRQDFYMLMEAPYSSITVEKHISEIQFIEKIIEE